MRKLVFSQFVTLDGVVQGPGASYEDTSGGFTKGGWVMPFFDESLGAIIDARFQKAGGFVLGRKTYEIFAGHWPNVGDDDPVAAQLNHLPKYVASNTLTSAGWEGTTIMSGDVVEQVRDLKEGDGGELQIGGSGQFAQTLMELNLIDTYELMIFPVVLGEGKRVFEHGLDHALQLVDSKTTGNGVIVLTYDLAGPVTFIDFDAAEG